MAKSKTFWKTIKGKRFFFSVGKQPFSKNVYYVKIYKKGRSSLLEIIATYQVNAKSIKDAFLSARDYFVYSGGKRGYIDLTGMKSYRW